ncbi:MAG: hypothetical protein Q9204_004920 [Flavoplaca sp. TL-2023a]
MEEMIGIICTHMVLSSGASSAIGYQAQLIARACFVAAHGEQQENVDPISLFASAAETSKREFNNDDLLIVKSGFPRPKERFLDRLAELFTRKKKANFVTATAMDKRFCKVCALRRLS